MRRGTLAIPIAKRDGSSEPFRIAKLRRCLRLVLRPGQCDVARVAGALAEAVAHHLRDWGGARPPTSAYVYRCACTVMRQTGLGEGARRLAAHRREREFRRRRLRVFDPGRPGERSSCWRKATVAATLERRYGLTRPVARILAGEIESRVFALGYRAISKPLLEELMWNELAAWGLPEGGSGETRGLSWDRAVSGREEAQEED